MKKYIALAALLASVSASAFAQTMDSQTFRQMAMQSDAFEIASSRLALERSRNARVRDYAQNMIADHSQTSQALNGGRAVYSSTGEFMGSTVTGTLAGAGVGALVAGPVGAAVGAGVGATAGAAASSGQAASAAPMRMGVQLDPEKTAMLNQLASTSGPQFDRLYGQAQRMGHQEALGLYQAYAQNGTDPALRQYAQSVIPHLEQHLADTRSLPGAASGRRR
jgi:predicted outer membrane protein